VDTGSREENASKEKLLTTNALHLVQLARDRADFAGARLPDRDR
jgi:hypothetical protein